MAETMLLEIVSAERLVFSGEVKHLIVTGEVGELGIFPGHTQLLTSLVPGFVKADFADADSDVFYISGGMLEVQPDTATVLADTAIRAEDIDEAAVVAAKQQAEHAMQNRKGELDYSHAVMELAHAAAQIRAIQQIRRKA